MPIPTQLFPSARPQLPDTTVTHIVTALPLYHKFLGLDRRPPPTRTAPHYHRTRQALRPLRAMSRRCTAHQPSPPQHHQRRRRNMILRTRQTTLTSNSTFHPTPRMGRIRRQPPRIQPLKPLKPPKHHILPTRCQLARTTPRILIRSTTERLDRVPKCRLFPLLQARRNHLSLSRGTQRTPRCRADQWTMSQRTGSGIQVRGRTISGSIKIA